MTREDAAALIEAFRDREDDDAPPLNTYVLANAYLKVLGSLSPEEDAFSH